MFASHIASLTIVAYGFPGRPPAFASRGEPIRRRVLALRESISSDDDYEVEAKDTNRGTQTVEVTRIPKTAPNESEDREGREAVEEDQCEPIAISGLLSSSAFEKLKRIHCTLTLLRNHLPNLLQLPVLSPKNFALIYSTNVTVTGPSDEILGQGRDEVILLNRALAIAATTARGADRLIDLAVGGSTSSASGVECEMLIDPNNPLEVITLWKATLPAAPFGGGGAKEAVTEISGTTIVNISKEDGLVDNLKLTEVKLNGVRLIDSLGSAVASIRQVTRSVASSFFDETQREKRSTGNPLFDGLLNGIQQTFDTLPQTSADEKKTASLFVVPRQYWNITKFTDLEFTPPLSVDDYSVKNNVPLTGSEEFVKYALVQESLMSFATYGVHVLAGTAEVGGQLDLIRAMFSSDVKYTGGTEGGERTLLLQGKSKLSDLYRSLALLRESSDGDWSVSNILANATERTLTVSWESQSPINIEGTDIFHFEEPRLSLLSSNQRLPLVSDGDDFSAVIESILDDSRRDAPLKIGRVDNVKLIVSGVRAGSDWSQRFISAAMSMSGGPPDTTLVHLLKTLTNRQKRSSSRPGNSASTMRLLDDDAAIVFYALLGSLHTDLAKIANTAESPNVPGSDYLSDSVELRGLLGESIVRGRDGYLRLLRLAITSLSTAVATKIVRLATEPKTRIEITQQGNIRVVFILALWASPQIPSLGGGEPKGGDSGFGVPLKIEITSEYCIDDDGRVSEHKILESRLNGVLTPGDVFSQWIRRLSTGEEGQKGAGFSIIDALSWVRTIQQERGGKK